VLRPAARVFRAGGSSLAKKSVSRGVSLIGSGGIAVLVGAALAASVAVPACSSKFSDCSDSYTCASGGSAGSAGASAGAGGTSAGASGSANGVSGSDNTEGGASGAAGAGGQAECSTDADCDDHDPCTASDTCKDSVCVHGDSPCVNPDSKNCDELCSNNGGKAKCTTVGQDADGYKHLSAACAAAPGDDCDDSQPTVYKGAKEVCDGLDNDCNGKADVYDGLPLANTQQQVSALGEVVSRPHIAWEPTSKVFGITWAFSTAGSTTQAVAFTAFDMTGKNVVTPRIVKSADGAITDARIATKAGTFGILWAVDYASGQHAIAFDTVTPTGTIDSNTIFPAPSSATHVLSPRMAINPSNNWLFAWLEYATDPTSTTVEALTLDDGGQLTPKHEMMPASARTEFAFTLNTKRLVGADIASSIDVGLGDPDTAVMYGLTPDADIVNPSKPLLLTGGSDFLLAGTTNVTGGEAILLKPPDGLILDPNQTIECGPVALPFAPQGAAWIDDAHGYVIANGEQLVNVTSKCEVSGVLSPGFAGNPGDVASAGVDTGLGLTSTNGLDKITFRPLSPLLCK